MNAGDAVRRAGRLLAAGALCGWLAACGRLPGQGAPFALGPLHFGMTVADMERAFADKERVLDAYDTALGEIWTITQPFEPSPPAPTWLSAEVDRLSLTFWDGRLVRLRLHYRTADLARATEFRQRFANGYRLEADLSQGERLFLDWRSDNLAVFLSGGDRNLAVAFVDLPAYYALDASRRRLVQKAEEAFTIEGLRFGASEAEARRRLGGRPTPSTFFSGLPSVSWKDAAAQTELILGFAPELGLAAMARLYETRWPPAQVQQRLWELTRVYGQGRLEPSANGRTLTIPAGSLRLTLMILDCDESGCMVSEGCLWTGPPTPERAAASGDGAAPPGAR